MTPRRPRARAIYVFSGAVLALAALFSACADNRFGLGDECLKDEDCLSGYCSQSMCVAAPPIGITSPPDASGDTTAGEGGGGDAADASGADSPPDTTGPADAADGPPADANRPDAHEGGTDANGADAELDAPIDAPVDAASDALVDAVADATGVADADDGGSNDASDDGG
jgi:hypothetical protein